MQRCAARSHGAQRQLLAASRTEERQQYETLRWSDLASRTGAPRKLPWKPVKDRGNELLLDMLCRTAVGVSQAMGSPLEPRCAEVELEEQAGHRLRWWATPLCQRAAEAQIDALAGTFDCR